MTTEGIQAFLAVCRWKTATRAASMLYINQSSLSIRLKTLEQELGGQLFSRQKGGREMKLTPMGEALYPLAQQYEQTVERILQVCKNQANRLRVSSLSSLGTYLFPEVYELFLQRNPDVELQVQDMDVDAAVESIRRGFTDVAFATRDISEQRIHSLHVFNEPMTLLCSVDSPYPHNTEVDMLPLEKEIYVDWFDEFETWHRGSFGAQGVPKVKISLMEQLRRFLQKDGSWAIVPVSVAAGLERDSRIRRCSPQFSLPEREIYCIYHPAMSADPNMKNLLKCLRDVMARWPELVLAEPQQEENAAL